MNYLIVIVCIILLGLFSRKISYIPLFFGDLLYATMVYFIMKFLLINTSNQKIAWISFVICATIECSQLYQSYWITVLRKTILGHYILGEGFLFSDLLAYFFGVLIGYILDRTGK